jgi:tetratricopeptide (TPR) repeat protein
MSRCPAFEEFHRIYITDYIRNYHINHIIKLIEEFAEKHKNTLDGELAFELRALLHILFGEFEEALTILTRYENSVYDLSRISTYRYLIRYYGGANNPSIDLKKRDEYYQKFHDLHPKLVLTNEWEKKIFGIYKVIEEFFWETDLEKKADYIPILKRLICKIPGYESTFIVLDEAHYGGFFYALGRFDEAREDYELIIKYCKSDWSILGYRGLIYLAINKGDLIEAEEYLNQVWDLVEEGGHYWIKTLMYSIKARLAELRFNIEEAEKVQLDIVTLNESEGKELHVFKALFNLFEFYYRVFQITDNLEYKEKVGNTQSKLEKLAENYPKDLTITRLAKLTKAELLKLGGIKDRTKAIFIFEELLEVYPQSLATMEVYPRSLDIRMHLVELYFEDLARDSTGEAKRIIDSYLDDIQKSPLMKNPTTVSEYSSYQILIAKYIYYLEGDINKALNILYDLQEQAEKLRLKPVEENISKEIKTLEGEIQKWKGVDLTTKERIEKSNIQSYFKSANKLIRLNVPDELK